MAKNNLWVYDFLVDGKVLSVFALSSNDRLCLRALYDGKLFERRCFFAGDSGQPSAETAKGRLATGRLMGSGSGELEIEFLISPLTVFKSGSVLPKAVKLNYFAAVMAKGNLSIDGKKTKITAHGIVSWAAAANMPKRFCVYSALSGQAVFGAFFCDNAIFKMEYPSAFCAGDIKGRIIKYGTVFADSAYSDTGSALKIDIKKGAQRVSAAVPANAESIFKAEDLQLRAANSLPSVLNIFAGGKARQYDVKSSYIICGKVRSAPPQTVKADEEEHAAVGLGIK